MKSVKIDTTPVENGSKLNRYVTDTSEYGNKSRGKQSTIQGGGNLSHINKMMNTADCVDCHVKFSTNLDSGNISQD